MVGALDHVHEGESVAVQGGWQRHPRHGWRFVAERARVEEPASEQALLAYLGSVKHVGPRGAAWLLEHHGPEQVLAAIDRDPERALRAIPGIGQARIGAAVRSWEDQGALRAVRLFLEEHGVPAAVAARIYRAYGPGAIETLRSDPYGLTELDGIGFATADALAQALGTPPDSPGRLDAGLRHALVEAESDGHCHLPRAELAERARRLLGADADDRIDELAARGRLVIDGDRVFDPAMHAVEMAACPSRARAHRRRAAAAAGRDRAPHRRAARPPTTSGRWCARSSTAAWRSSPGGPGTGKTHDDARARRPPARRAPHRPPVRAHRQGGAAAGRDHRGAGDHDPSPARVLTRRGLHPRCRGPDPRHRRAHRRRGLDALRAPGRGAVRRRRPAHPRAARGRRRPARAGRPRPRARRPHRVRPRAGRAPDRHLPPGRALAHRPRRARGQRRPAAADRGRRRRPARLLRHRAHGPRRHPRRGRRARLAAPAGPLRPRPARRGPRGGAHAPRAGRHRRAQRRAARAPERRRCRHRRHAAARRTTV